MIVDSALSAVVNSGDTSLVAEIYHQDATPTADGFDPADALKRYAAVEGITFAGENYTRIVRNFGSARRTTTEESNTFNIDFSNLSREISEFEFETGFEGLIIVWRLISRSLSTTLAKSIILYVGRCNKPTSGDTKSLPVTAKSILDTVDAEIPRRKFTATDAEGRTPDNVLFEGFPYMPQQNAGTSTYTARKKAWGFLGWIGFKKTVTKTLSYSSFSDMDAEKFLPVVAGRAQIMLTHLAYADIGSRIRMTSAACEGQIENFATYRTDDVRFFLDAATVVKRLGLLGNVGTQVPHTTGSWIGNGYYSRTALLFAEATGTNVQNVDPAPGLIAVILGTVMTVIDASGDWVTLNSWTDNPAAHARFIFTSTDYYKLDENWLDDESFTESYNFNDEIIFDRSYSDILFLPNTARFTGADSEKTRFLASTGLCTTNFFKYLEGAKTTGETFLQTPYVEPYDTDIPGSPSRPGDPIEPPTDFPGQSANLSFFLRRRYTANWVVTEQMKLVDFLHKFLFVGSRTYLTQGANGKLKLKNKKPADWGMGTAALSGTTIALDDVRAWISDKRGFALLDPHTVNSELRTVSAAVYPVAHNSVTLTASVNITVSGFAGCDGAATPATATLTIDSIVAGTPNVVTLDGTQFSFTGNALDTVNTAAGFLYGAINGHPVLNRKFVATWTAGTAIVTIKPKFGNLTISSALEMMHTAPLANPTVAPVLTATAGGSLPAGFYIVGYTNVNARGQTLMAPVGTVTLTANQKIEVGAIALPAGATGRNWFTVPVQNSNKLRFHSLDATGNSFFINSLPLLTAALTPDVNRTGCEVMRVETAFSDRAETRSAMTRSNVLQATYKWKLGNREKPINRIDLKFRDSTQDFRLVELRLRDDEHIAKTKKISNFEVNGQSIDNCHQAYRIASGMLAELRDADFFYEWSSDRDAILLEEGDVVAITDDGAQVYNLPVRIESMEFTEDGGFVKVNFIARKYAGTLYDDSVAERQISVIIETNQGVDYV